MIELKEIDKAKYYRPPSWDRLFFRLVYEYASKSKDPSSKIGAIIVKDRRPILFGYNGFPEGVEDTPERLNNREEKYMLVEHAERNALDMASRFGIKTEGGILYTQVLPCAGCAKGIIQAKIKEIVLHQPADDYFRNKSVSSLNWKKDHEYSTTMFKEAGVHIRYFNEMVGSIAFFGGAVLKA